jgi:hypothetical protein
MFHNHYSLFSFKFCCTFTGTNLTWHRDRNLSRPLQIGKAAGMKFGNCNAPATLPFILQPRKSREYFDILNSHNLLSTRCLQKTVEPSIYNNAEIGKAEDRNVFKEFDRGLHGLHGCPETEKNPGRTGKKTCKSVGHEEHHKKGPCWSWARIQMGNADKNIRRFAGDTGGAAMLYFSRERVGLTLIIFWLLCPLLPGRSQSVSICGVPTNLPINTSYGEYSPTLCFGYSGLSTEDYTMAVWLLTPSLGYCASTQWCSNTFTINNISGTNSAGTIQIAETMDVYNYTEFEWVVRLYDHTGAQASFAQQDIEGVSNTTPSLAPVTNQTIQLGQTLHVQLVASDADGQTPTYGAQSLPTGAILHSDSGEFEWTPPAAGSYAIEFTATDNTDGPLTVTQSATFTVISTPVITITAPPQNQAVQAGTHNVTFSVGASNTLPLTYRWSFNGKSIPAGTNSTLKVGTATTAKAGVYQVSVSNAVGSGISEEAVLDVYSSRTSRESEQLAVEHLRKEMDLYHDRILVYDDIGSGGNHFLAQGQLPDSNSPVTMDTSWSNSPHSGATAICCALLTNGSTNWGGFYLMNGLLVSNVGVPYFGQATVPGISNLITNCSGMNLSGASTLTFWLRGDKGNEKVQIFMGGVGWDVDSGKPTEPFPDSTRRWPKEGKLFTATTHWTKHTISLAGLNLTNIMGGLGWVADLTNNPDGAVFYLDDIQYNLNPGTLERRLNEPHFIRSYVTLPIQPGTPESAGTEDFDYDLRNSAFTYDNALAILAFLADGTADSLRRANILGQAFLFAMNNDRYYTNGQVRSAYAAGDIAVPPGWTVNGKTNTVAIPGFYDYSSNSFDEVESADIDTGNNAWTMIALLDLYEKTQHTVYKKQSTNYLNAAIRLGNYINTFRSDSGLYQGFLGGITDAESTNTSRRMYASTEHNLDINAAFTQMYSATGDPTWSDGAAHAQSFVESMWDDALGCYLAGTTSPGVLNLVAGELPLDVQSWNVLSRTNVLALHPGLLTNALNEFGCTVDGFTGFDFNTNRDGVWFEGTGQMCVAYAFSGQPESQEMAKTLAATLSHAQQMPPPFGDGLGLVAASHDALATGFNNDYGPNYYYRRMHLAATSWLIFAQLGYNPYYQTRVKLK